MVQMSVIEAQLTKLGVRKTFFCKPEIRELQHILMDDEDIIKFVNGRYAGGFAILVATEQRLLLIDKKPLYLTVEDIRYDMISEVDVNSRLFDGTVTIFTVNRQLAFTSMRQRQLRELTAYVQKRVMEIRHYGREVSPAPKVAQPELPQMPTQQTDPYVPTMASTVTHSLAAHMPHVPAPISDAVAHTRDYLPDHLPQAIGSTATRLASRLQQHNNPYTKAPLMVRQRWSNWSNP